MKRQILSVVACAVLFATPTPSFAQDMDEETPQDAEEEELTPAEAIQQRLESQSISLNFDGTPFDEVVDFLRDITGLNLVMDPALETEEITVSLRLQDISLRNAVNLILASSDDGLEYQIWCDVVYLTKKDAKLPAIPEADDSDLGKTLRSRKATLNFSETPLTEVVNFLQDITGLNVVIHADAADKAEDTAVSLRVREINMVQVVNLATLPHGLTWEITNDAVLIKLR